MFSLPTSKVIFAGILDKSSKDGVTHLVNNKDLVEDNVRADTPVSGGGGYFTLSESDTGSTLGKESPNPIIKRSNDMYKISKSYSDAQDNTKNRRICILLFPRSFQEKNILKEEELSSIKMWMFLISNHWKRSSPYKFSPHPWWKLSREQAAQKIFTMDQLQQDFPMLAKHSLIVQKKRKHISRIQILSQLAKILPEIKQNVLNFLG